jgi:EAL domain-containing protein (putative c-di-GMP-specific phosphodiesterase class I)
MIHLGKNTSSRIISKGISAGRSQNTYRGLVSAHRKRGALIALDDLSGGTESLAYHEPLKPDFAKIDNKLTAGIQFSAGRRRLVAALVECAHECNARVVAEGVERVGEFEAMRDLGVEFGQGFYFGQPTERPMAVDTRLVRARPEL